MTRVQELENLIKEEKNIIKRCELQDELDELNGKTEARQKNLCNMDSGECENCGS